MTYAAALSVVRRYLKEYLPEPMNPRAINEFKERTYSRWAANEIICRIIDEELKLPYHISGLEQRVPVEVVKEFVDELYTAWELSTKKDQKMVYSCALHTAEDILLRLYY